MKESYLLHRLVWRDDSTGLQAALDEENGAPGVLEVKDPRGRTALMLAVTLGHASCARVLLQAKANADKCVNAGGWSLVQEAVSRGIPEVLTAVLEAREVQRRVSRRGWIPRLLHKLRNAPDFYVEMKWEFTSWLPLFSRMCPSDVYKIYKRGSRLRIDTTLLRFDSTSWARGNRSYIFSPGSGDSAHILKIDHDAKTFVSEKWDFGPPDASRPPEREISTRMVNPLIFTFLDTEKINFERSKTPSYILWGSSEKSENISGYDCKVFAANNVELVTKTRLEHLPPGTKAKVSAGPISNPLLNSLLSQSEVDESAKPPPAEERPGVTEGNPYGIPESTYFNPSVSLEDADIGIPKEVRTRVQKFKAQLWLSETYPLSLQEQIMPIIDLLSLNNAHYQKLKDFFTLQFPSGFPVKIEIPLFHALNSRITFENIFGLDKPPEGVSVISESPSRITAVVDDSVFQIPHGYVQMGDRSFENDVFDIGGDEDDDRFLQYAISQSMSEAGEEEEMDIYEALRSPARSDSCLEIQQAIEASLRGEERPPNGGSPLPPSSRETLPSQGPQNNNNSEDDLQLAIALSEKEQESNLRREREEQEILERILALSMTEK